MTTITLPFDRPLSHPPDPEHGDLDGVPLIDHLDEVGTRARMLAERGGASQIVDLTHVSGQLHDFGKVTPFFQFYIDGNAPEPSELKNHSPLGALAAYHVLDARGWDRRLALVALVAIAKHHGTLPNVVEYVNDTALGEQRAELLRTQVAAISQTTASTANEILKGVSNGTTDWQTFVKALTSGDLKATITNQITRRAGQLDLNACSPQFYDWVMQVWGALVVSDKTSAAEISTHAFEASYGDPRAVPGHVRMLQLEAEREAEARGEELSADLRELNAYRDQARESIVENARAITQTQGGSGWVGELTLPTGLGKTLSALETGQVISAEQPERGRIIYALPYTSIIDQTATVIENVFEADKTTNELTIHHNLEETVTEIDEYRRRRARAESTPRQFAREEYLIAKGWNSGMVLTTYVQLFESLVRPSNQQSMKLPALYNSIIILDEPQSLPLDWWRLIRRVIQTLIETYDATVISMTATQPKILTGSTCEFDVHELVDDPDQYFELVERVEYQYHPSLEAYLEDPANAAPLTHADAGEEIVEHLSDEEPTGLAICNTVASAQELSNQVDLAARQYTRISLTDKYDPLAAQSDDALKPEQADGETMVECRARLLLDRLDETLTRPETDKPLVTLHLTTRHRPIDRKVLLKAASQLSSRREIPFVFVATQLVEAGVDVSFTRVYRDFGPMSSLVQAAGRCNRSAERDRGTVTIWRLEATENDSLPPSQLVYGIDMYNKLEPTARALSAVAPAIGQETRLGSGRVVEELAVARAGIEAYYEALDDRDVGTQQYVDWLDSAQFAKLRELSLIAEREVFDVVVCRSSTERTYVQLLQEALAAGNVGTARKYLSELEEMQVSLPVSASEGSSPADSTTIAVGGHKFYVVDARASEGLYDGRLGLLG
jgi:CRISPR-associated endonuclease Cas3-HD